MKNVIRVGGSVPLVLGAFALDPSVAAATTCDLSDSSLACSDETLGDAKVSIGDGGEARVAYSGDAVTARAAVSPGGVLVECYLCTIDSGPVKGHPACLSGFDPVVDPWVSETVSEILKTATG